jgi:hypothetical protein
MPDAISGDLSAQTVIPTTGTDSVADDVTRSARPQGSGVRVVSLAANVERLMWSVRDA